MSDNGDYVWILGTYMTKFGRHTDKDLILPIVAAGKRLLDAVDGARSIGDIVAADVAALQAPLAPQLARDFFERLWWWDQVVFDTSRQAGG